MRKIVIIGNSAAGFGAHQAFLSAADKFEVTVISREETPAYKKESLLGLLSGDLKEKDIFLSDLKPVSGTVARLDMKKRKAVLKDNSRIDFDSLIIASGLAIDAPDVPGKMKEGIFRFYSIEDVRQIRDRLLVAHSVCVMGDGPAAQKLAEGLSAQGKDVNVSGPCDLAEFIGEGGLQAVKLKSGKVIGADMAIFTGPLRPSVDFLKETGIGLDNGFISVDADSRTSLDDCFACGSVCKTKDSAPADNWDDAARQGRSCAQFIIDQTKKE